MAGIGKKEWGRVFFLLPPVLFCDEIETRKRDEDVPRACRSGSLDIVASDTHERERESGKKKERMFCFFFLRSFSLFRLSSPITT